MVCTHTHTPPTSSWPHSDYSLWTAHVGAAVWPPSASLFMKTISDDHQRRGHSLTSSLLPQASSTPVKGTRLLWPPADTRLPHRRHLCDTPQIHVWTQSEADSAAISCPRLRCKYRTVKTALVRRTKHVDATEHIWCVVQQDFCASVSVNVTGVRSTPGLVQWDVHLFFDVIKVTLLTLRFLTSDQREPPHQPPEVSRGRDHSRENLQPHAELSEL